MGKLTALIYFGGLVVISILGTVKNIQPDFDGFLVKIEKNISNK